MANDEHVAILEQGMEAWNAWREKNPGIVPDLTKSDLVGADLTGAILYLTDLVDADLRGARLRGANLTEANLVGANLQGAGLMEAPLERADLGGANLRDAKLMQADLRDANLNKANLSGANLFGANLQDVMLVETDLTGADLSGCRIYGVSAWGLIIKPPESAKQHNLIITRPDEPTVTVDNIEVAQFVYLLLHNEKIRDVIDTVGKKAVLLLGRFTDERKAVLDALRRNCASVTTCRFCSTLMFQLHGTLPRPSRCWLIWPASSLPI